jgi:hypothetical protein
MGGVAKNKGHEARQQWLMPIILATWRQRSGGSWFKASWANSSQNPILKKKHHKKGLLEWLKV